MQKKQDEKKLEKGIILLLEDNAHIMEINRRMLEKEGLVVLSAETIAQARDHIKAVAPDVAVLDIMLPDGSGLDFLDELREVCGAPALFLTAKSKRADVLAGLKAGGNDYITKPYNIDEFRLRVTNFLRFSGTVKSRRSVMPAVSVLTEKELVIAVLASRGLLNKEIADEVCLSESRVKTCLSGIYRKLGLTDKENKRELLAKVLEK